MGSLRRETKTPLLQYTVLTYITLSTCPIEHIRRATTDRPHADWRSLSRYMLGHVDCHQPSSPVRASDDGKCLITGAGQAVSDIISQSILSLMVLGKRPSSVSGELNQAHRSWNWQERQQMAKQLPCLPSQKVHRQDGAGENANTCSPTLLTGEPVSAQVS